MSSSRRWLALAGASILLLVYPSRIVLAHGIELEVTRAGTVLRGVVREPQGPVMAGMPVSVSIPPQLQPRFTGESDAAGRFEFTVDPAAVYRVVVDDGLGHRAVATVAPLSMVAGAGTLSSAGEVSPGMPWQEWLVGLGLIGALAALAAWVMGRRREVR